MDTLNFTWLIEGRLAGHRGPSSEQDLLRLRERGVLALIRMQVSSEAKISSAEAERLGLSDCHEPVADFNPPKQSQIDRMVGFIVKELSGGRPVGVSCGAGLGRTGTILACYLVHEGYTADQAVDEVRAKRPGSIETEAQENAVTTYARRIAKGSLLQRSNKRPPKSALKSHA